MSVAPDTEQLAALEAFVVENDDLLDLEARLGKFNIFDALGVARAEIRHSNFLAWLLDPSESHGQGQVFLKAILADVLRKAPPDRRPFSALEVDGIDLRGIEVRREWQRIDVLIICDEPRFGVVVENKIDSGEHRDQLTRYVQSYRARYGDRPTLLVFLTATGLDASNEDWISYTYADIYRVLSRSMRTQSGAIGDDVRMVLDHYLRLIGSRLMNDATIVELCRRIYRNHRQALDLIFDTVGTVNDGILTSVEEVVRNDPTWHLFNVTGKRVDFTLREWAEVTPPLCTWPNQDPRFWLRSWIYRNESNLKLCVEVGPCSDASLRTRVIDRITAVAETGFKTKGKPKPTWTRVYSQTITEWEDEPDEVQLTVLVKASLASLSARMHAATPALRDLFSPAPM